MNSERLDAIEERLDELGADEPPELVLERIENFRRRHYLIFVGLGSFFTLLYLLSIYTAGLLYTAQSEAEAAVAEVAPPWIAPEAGFWYLMGLLAVQGFVFAIFSLSAFKFRHARPTIKSVVDVPDEIAADGDGGDSS